MEELADYLESFRAEREAGEKTADAYRLAMLNVLTREMQRGGNRRCAEPEAPEQQ